MSMTLAERLVAAARHARHARVAMEHDCMAFNHRSLASAIICACNAPWAKYALGPDAVYVDGHMPPDLREQITAAGGRIWSLSDLDHQIKA